MATRKYSQEFREKILRLHFEEGRSIRSLNEEYHIGDGTVRYWIRQFQEECGNNPDLTLHHDICEENRQLREELSKLRKENSFLKKAAAFFEENTV